MTVTESVARARADTLVDRILNDPREKVTDRELAFRLCQLRRWLVRVGVDGPEVEFTTVLGGQTVAWKLTARGNVVAEETLAEGERAA